MLNATEFDIIAAHNALTSLRTALNLPNLSIKTDADGVTVYSGTLHSSRFEIECAEKGLQVGPYLLAYVSTTHGGSGTCWISFVAPLGEGLRLEVTAFV